MTKDDFIEKSIKVHGNTYDYSLVADEFLSTTKVDIICKVHGTFSQVAGNHYTNKMGCRKCAYEKQRILRSNQSSSIYPFDDFINDLNLIHGNKLSVIKESYSGLNKPVKIIIRDTNEEKIINTAKFLLVNKKFNMDNIYGIDYTSELSYFNTFIESLDTNIYDFSLSKFISNETSLTFFHKKLNITIELFRARYLFEDLEYSIRNPRRFKYVINTPEDLYYLNINNYTKGILLGTKSIEFKTNYIKFAGTLIHGNKYNYDAIVLDTSIMKSKLKIWCNIHKEFFYQRYEEHINLNMGCTKCGIEDALKKKNIYYDKESFISKLHEKFDYIRLVDGNSYKTRNDYYNNLEFKCTNPYHNHKEVIYSTTPEKALNTLTGNCPSCRSISSLEKDLDKELSLYSDLNYITNTKKIISPLELDFYFPDNNIAIELNGNYWHSDMYMEHSKARNHMYEKYSICKDNGIQLLSFYEDEIKYKFDIVMNIVKHRLNLHDNSIYARKCEVFEISKQDAEAFLNKYHLQGFARSQVHLGLFLKNTNKLVSVMSFSFTVSNRGSVANETDYELVRFASKTNVVGAASKLLKAFINFYEPKKIVSYSDNRISDGNLYKVLGFNKVKDVPLDYYYIHKNNTNIRYHKSYLTKAKQSKKFDNYDPILTEYENSRNNGYYRIWNCGLIKWELVLN